jgi:GNAT superfamily N-acetyltransferase
MRYVPRLDRDLVAEAARQHHVLWGGDRTIAQQIERNLLQLETAGPELMRYIGLVGARGQLLGSAKRYSLVLTDGRHEHRAIGFGAVFTNPKARGKGVATTLLRAAMEEARDHGYGAAILYSDIDPPFYERLGFVTLPARDFVVDTADLPARGALDLRRARPGELDALRSHYDAAWRRDLPGFVRPVRTRATWRFFKWRSRIPAEWIVRHRGRDAGYLLAQPTDPQRDVPDPHEPGLLWFDEACTTSADLPPDRLWATVRALAEKARLRGVKGWIGPNGAPPGARRLARGGTIPMIAPLVPELVVRPKRAWLDSFVVPRAL